MSDSVRQNGNTNDEQLSDETLEAVAGGAGELRALPGVIDIKPPIVRLPGGDDNVFPLPVPISTDLSA